MEIKELPQIRESVSCRAVRLAAAGIFTVPSAPS
jgi:hypothetical protein